MIADRPSKERDRWPPPEPTPAVSARVAAIAESATLAVDAKAKALQAAGEPVIGFGAGEPDFPTPAHIVEAAVAACRDPKNHKYTPGRRPPRAEGGDRRQDDARLRATTCRPRAVLVTNGGKHAVYNTFTALLDPGDEVLLPAPYWTTYPEPIALAGGVSVVLPTDETTGFRVTVDQLEAARTERTKILLFVSPSNPTGAVYPAEEVEAIGRWAVEHGHLGRHRRDLRAPHLRRPPARVDARRRCPSWRDRCVVLNGVAKTYAMTGWRVGWMLGPDDVIKAATNLQSHATSNVANVSQRAAIAALTGDLEAVAEMRTAFERRGQAHAPAAHGHRGRHRHRAAGRVLRLPQPVGLPRPHDPRPHRRDHRSSCARCSSTRPRWPSSPARPSTRPATRGCSYALGDDDLGEGCRRIADLLAES